MGQVCALSDFQELHRDRKNMYSFYSTAIPSCLVPLVLFPERGFYITTVIFTIAKICYCCFLLIYFFRLISLIYHLFVLARPCSIIIVSLSSFLTSSALFFCKFWLCFIFILSVLSFFGVFALSMLFSFTLTLFTLSLIFPFVP